jgi:(p)ppGpp synthase/HD superfamily hydrolase
VAGTGSWSHRELRQLPKTRAALTFARREHEGQLRSTDGAPFIEHPIEVSRLLYKAGAVDHVIAVGLLHDVLEKTEVTAAELRAMFGVRISRLVAAVSEDEQIAGYVRRKAALRQQVAGAGPEALMVFAADKISKIGELRMAVGSAAQRHEALDQSIVRPRRLVHFRRCLDMLEDRFGTSPLVPRLRAELTHLNRDLRSLTEFSAAA